MGTSGVAGTQRLCVKAGALKVSLRRAMGSHGVCVYVSRSRRGTGSVMGRKELELEAQTKRVLPALQALPTLHPRAPQFWLAAFLRWQRAQRRASVACLSLL